VAAGQIPKDSLVVRGARFSELAWGSEPRPVEETSVQPVATTELIDLANAFYRTWSQSDGKALAFLRRSYADELTYHGKLMKKAEVLLEKAEFAARWPERSYSIQPATIATLCSDDGLCKVEGVVAWRAYSSARNVTSEGTARFSLTFTQGEPPMIVGEWSEVLERRTRKGR
jgi:hypothetical protein